MNTQPSSNLAAIYGRVSTDKQDDSLELQEKRTLEYAAWQKLTVPPTLMFSDPDTSGSIAMRERTGGRLLLNRLATGEIKHLIIAKLDRLGRNVIDGIGTLEFCKQHDITLHIVDLGGDTITTQSHVGRFILTLLFGVAEWERCEISDRTRKHMRKLFDSNELTGHIPFGYGCVYTFPDQFAVTRTADPIPASELAQLEQQHGGKPKKHLTGNDDEQAIIRLIAGMKRNKCRLDDIAKDLNKRGLRTKLGRDWKAGNVKSVLNNRHTRRLLEQTTTAYEIPAIQSLSSRLDLLPANQQPQCTIA